LAEQPAATSSPASALAALPLFAGVPSEARAAFADQWRRHGYRAGTVLFLQGDPPDDVCCILSGRTEITSATADGRARLLAIAAPGDLLGELGVLGGMPRSGTATCVSDTMAWMVDGRRFVRFLSDQPAAALALLSVLARQVVTQDGLVDDLLFLDLKGRVAKRLLGLATSSWEQPPANGAVVDWGLPQADLASLCGGTRASVNRVLADLDRRGLITHSQRRYVLRDVDRLRRLAGL
jgi:CRP/FNR family transcriptional regulator/CRP/FNR family cyclic AMP-dependent transcriptional regulator